MINYLDLATMQSILQTAAVSRPIRVNVSLAKKKSVQGQGTMVDVTVSYNENGYIDEFKYDDDQDFRKDRDQDALTLLESIVGGSFLVSQTSFGGNNYFFDISTNPEFERDFGLFQRSCAGKR